MYLLLIKKKENFRNFLTKGKSKMASKVNDVSAKNDVSNKNVKLAKEMDLIRDKLDDTSTVIAGRNGINMFPAHYAPGDTEADRRFQLKRNLVAGTPNAQPVINIGKEEMDYLRRKAEQEDRIQFDQWFAQLFDQSDITEQRIARELHPGFFKEREDYIKQQAELQIRLAMMELYGIRDEQDLKILYALQNGKINLRKKPLYELYTPDDEEKRYQKGLFSPKRFMSASQTLTNTGAQRFDTNTFMPAGTTFAPARKREMGNSYSSILAYLKK